jgi:hypothetical protein
LIWLFEKRSQPVFLLFVQIICLSHLPLWSIKVWSIKKVNLGYETTKVSWL